MIHKIKYRIFAAALFILSLGLMACATPDVTVLGHCPVPERYDTVKTGPVDLTAIELKQHFEEEAAQRHQHKVDANDFNSLVGYMKENCQ